MKGKHPTYEWMNGEIIPTEDAKIHVRCDAFRRGASVFEGTMAYTSADQRQLYIFRNAAHMDRFFNCSMKILRMQLKWSAEDLTRAMLELLRANNTREDVVIRLQAYFGEGGYHAFDPSEIETGCAIMVDEHPDRPILRRGMNACVSSWQRIDDNVMPARVKAGANYLNSRYSMMEAKIEGYDYAFMLNGRSKVAEGPGACIMMVRHGKVVTPAVTAGVLEAVTRTTLIELFAREMDMEVVEREVDRTELYIADEVFLCGSSMEVQPVISVDKYPVGNGQVGPVTMRMQQLYFQVVRGENPKYGEWLTPVY